MQKFLFLAVTCGSCFVAEKVPLLPTKVIRSLDEAIAETLQQNCTSFVLAISRIRADILVQATRYHNPPSLSVVINSPTNMLPLLRVLRRECKRGAHAVLFHAPSGGRGSIFDPLCSSNWLFPYLTLVFFTPSEAAGKPCDSMRQLHCPSIAFTEEKVEICKGPYHLPETQLWSGLRRRDIVIACGEGRPFCDEKFNAAILVSLKFLNASVTLHQGGMYWVKATKAGLKSMSADITLAYDMLDEETPFEFHISPLLIDKRVIFYAHVRHARVKTWARSQFLSHELLGIIYATAAVLGSLLAVAAIAMMTERYLHEPAFGLLEVFFSVALSKGYNLSKDKFSSNTRRVLFSFWSLACLCIVVYVQSVITSTVIVPVRQSNVLTFESLCDAIRKESLCHCGDEEALGYLRELTTWRNMTKSLLKSNRKTAHCHWLIPPEKCPQKVREKTHVGFDINVNDGKCTDQLGDDLIFGQKPLGRTLSGSFVRKGYPLARHYHSLVRREIETGLFERLQSLRQSPCTRNHNREEFSGRYTPFVACITGCALATFICAGEIFMPKYFGKPALTRRT